MGNATVYTKAQVDQIVSNIVIGLERRAATIYDNTGGTYTANDNDMGYYTEPTGSAGDHSHTISGGDVETAPVHVSLHTFIKIN
jgi:hypothetical protein